MENRTFRESDEQAVIDLWRAVSAKSAPHNDPVTAIRKKLAVDRDLFLVAEVDGTVVGTVLGGYDGHRGWVYAVAVHSEHRRRGIGSALIRRIEAALAERGCLKVNLQVLASNPGAVTFYENLGYSVEERVSMGKRLYE
jgi:ribosomal protein S18 acetylase RimI-like enzyme